MSDENQNNTNTNKNAFDCLRAIENAFPNNERFTIGDLHAIVPEFPGGVSGLRRTVFICASKVDALVETTTTTAAKTTTMKEQQQREEEEERRRRRKKIRGGVFLPETLSIGLHGARCRFSRFFVEKTNVSRVLHVFAREF